MVGPGCNYKNSPSANFYFRAQVGKLLQLDVEGVRPGKHACDEMMYHEPDKHQRDTTTNNTQRNHTQLRNMHDKKKDICTQSSTLQVPKVPPPLIYCRRLEV